MPPARFPGLKRPFLWVTLWTRSANISSMQTAPTTLSLKRFKRQPPCPAGHWRHEQGPSAMVKRLSSTLLANSGKVVRMRYHRTPEKLRGTDVTLSQLALLPETGRMDQKSKSKTFSLGALPAWRQTAGMPKAPVSSFIAQNCAHERFTRSGQRRAWTVCEERRHGARQVHRYLEDAHSRGDARTIPTEGGCGGLHALGVDARSGLPGSARRYVRRTHGGTAQRNVGSARATKGPHGTHIQDRQGGVETGSMQTSFREVCVC